LDTGHNLTPPGGPVSAFEREGLLDPRLVGVACGTPSYGEEPPYSPGEAWPEYPFTAQLISGKPNPAYQAVREALRLLGLDAPHFGTAGWNPLGAVVRPGDMVVLKPNFVREFRESDSGHRDCLITHGAIIRAVLDYALIATGGRGRIIVADAPHNDADFEAIRRIAGLDEIQAFFERHAGTKIEAYDLRPERAKKINGVIVGHAPLPGDPAGYAKVDLGRHSTFNEVSHLCHLLYGSEYDTREIVRHHTGGRHEYLISKTVLSADCVISLPKLKTHKKVGITVNLKNLVGINGNKNWLPHHREGPPSEGGDQFSAGGLKNRIERATVAGFKRVFPMLGPLRSAVAAPIKKAGRRIFGDTNTDTVRSGNWYGNDTAWRMCLDLNRILMYTAKDGSLLERPVRRFLSVVDGIIGGEGNGPLDPVPRPAGLVLAGTNPVAVDLACARLMGFDYRRLPVVLRGFDEDELPLARFSPREVVSRSNQAEFDRPISEFRGPALGFRPHFGWKDHLEIRDHQGAGARDP
jgi:uncharacterized protein (DUF362 family)